MISCFAIVGKGERGTTEPVFYRLYRDEHERADGADLRFHRILHSSLDLVEQARSAAGKKSMYLGLLGPTDEHKVYGYVTGTQMKLLGVVEDTSDVQVKDAELAQLFRSVHELYIKYMLNSMSPLGQNITSTSFRSAVDRQIDSYNQAVV